MVEWYSTVLAAQTVVGSSPVPNFHQCLWTRLQVGGSKRLSYHADLYTVSRCHTRDKSEDHKREKACKKGILPFFETQGRHHQKSKIGVSVVPRKGLMSSKNFFKKQIYWKKTKIGTPEDNLSAICFCEIFTTRICSTMGGYVFTSVCLFRWGVPHLHPIILPLVPCPFWGYPSDYSQIPSRRVPQSQVLDGGYPSPRWGATDRGIPSWDTPPPQPGQDGVPL